MGTPDFSVLDDVIDTFNAAGLKLRSGDPASDAIACLEDVRTNCETRVLATAKVGKWITGWGCSMAQLIHSAQQIAAFLWLVAKKGGAACDEELVLIAYILERMGFTLKQE